MRRNGLSVATTILIAGCAGTPVITDTHYDISYRELEYRAQPELPVIVDGNPFSIASIAQSESNRGVSDALQGRAFAATGHFVPASDDRSAPYIVVMHFAGEAAGDALALEGDRRTPDLQLRRPPVASIWPPSSAEAIRR